MVGLGYSGESAEANSKRLSQPLWGRGLGSCLFATGSEIYLLYRRVFRLEDSSLAFGISSFVQLFLFLKKKAKLRLEHTLWTHISVFKFI